ncbi:hypothetical protein HBO95_06780 [Staphylococcus aureus]|nr:hypothetical protein [Staphylococcus aureus]
MNKINDRDLTELSSYWVYQDINKDNDFTVNGKRFKQVDEYNDNGNKNKLKDANKLSEYNYMQNETYKSA